MLGVLSLFEQVYSITGKLMDICIYCEVKSPVLFSCMDNNCGKSINVYVCKIPTGDPLRQHCKYALEQQQLNAQYFENAVSDLRGKNDETHLSLCQSVAYRYVSSAKDLKPNTIVR